MKRKSMKSLSFALSAVMALSVANPGMVASATEADYVIEQQLESSEEVSEETTVEESTDAETTEVTVEEASTEEVNEESTQEALEEATTEIEEVATEGAEETQEEATTEVATEMAEEAEELQEIPTVEEKEPESQLASASATDLVSSVIEDSVLAGLVLEKYNAATGSSLTAANFTVDHLSNYEGELNFSGAASAQQVTSVKGLGIAVKATAIDISAFTGVSKIEANEFVKCSFTSFKMPSSITSIDEAAFSECQKLETIDLPVGLKSLGDAAFNKCYAMKAVNVQGGEENTLPSGLTSVGQNVFLGDTSLKEIKIPSFEGSEGGVLIQSSLGLFSGCSGLETITIGSGIKILPVEAFLSAGSATEKGVSIVFEDGSALEKILNKAFSGVKPLDGKVDLSKCTKMNAIAAGVFRDTTDLIMVVMPSSVPGTVQFGEYAFAKSSLEHMLIAGEDSTGIVIPEYVDTLGKGAFYGNQVMTSVTLPAALKEIPDHLFDDCIALDTVTQNVNASGSCSVALIGDCAFRSTAITNTDFMRPMSNLKQIGRQEVKTSFEGSLSDEQKIASLPLGGEQVDKFDVTNPSNKKYENKDCGSEVFTNCNALTDVYIPGSVEIIAHRAFYFPITENRVTNKVPKTINEMKAYIGGSTSLIKKIEWDKAVSGSVGKERNIYPEAFHNNGKLEELSLPQNENESLKIGDMAFLNAFNLKAVGYNGTFNQELPNTISRLGISSFMNLLELKEIHIQAYNDECPTLEPQAFEGAYSMKTATLPTQITEIPYHFFAGAPLTSFNFADMKNVVTIGNLAFLGHQFETLDLTALTKLEEIGGDAFGLLDCMDKRSYLRKNYDILTISSSPVLTKVILPTALNNTNGNTLFMNTGVFYGQSKFDTMGDSNNLTDKVMYIPDYIPVSSKAVFALTAVEKVVWEADSDNGNASMRWAELPTNMFEGCANIKKVSDVLPKYVQKIGKRAFAGSLVEIADLQDLVYLKEIGHGTLDSNQNEAGAFYGCEKLDTVTLPAQNIVVAGETPGILVGAQTFEKSAVSTVDLGATTTLDRQAFVGCNNLEQIDLKNVKKVESRAFYESAYLKNVKFGVVESIGDSAFEKCKALEMEKQGDKTLPLPDTLVTIGSRAFYECEALGDVVFGSGLKTINASAFGCSGTTSLDFKNASSLTTIGMSAFDSTLIKELVLEGTKVESINSNTFYRCSELENAKFGEEVKYIQRNALAACPKLRNFEFFASTIVSVETFYEAIKVDGIDWVTGNQNGNKNNEISITVRAPKETLIPLGREIAFPYNVNEAGKSNIDQILVYDNNNSTDMTAEEYFSVKTEVVDGYYKVKNSDESNGKYKVNPMYFTDLDEAETHAVKVEGRDVKVDSIMVEGLKVTEESRNLRFEVFANINFTNRLEKDGVKINTSSFKATYNVKVLDPAPVPMLYEDMKLETPMPLNKEIQQTNASRYITYYYTLEDQFDTGSTPENCNIVIETSNPDVIYPAGSTSDKPATTYTTTATVTNANGVTTTNKGNMRFVLISSGVGTATISVYPQDCNAEEKDRYKKTYTFTVNSDVQLLSLALPMEYRTEANPGAAFSVFSNYTNWFGQKCSAENMLDFNRLTNKKIVFTSDAPDYVSVDQLGNVKVLKADATPRRVTISATPEVSVGTPRTYQVVINVKHPTVNSNQEVTDPASGAKVKVTRPSTTDLQGEVTYQGPADANATQAVVPDTITIHGVKYKVTAIADGIFKDNTKITSVTIGSYIKEIKREMFSGCTSLASVTIGNGVETIGEKAFYGCKKLKTVNLPANGTLKTIGISAFEKCTALTKITIPKSVEKIDQRAFYGCKKLKTVTLSASGKLKSIGTSAFENCAALTKITIPKAVETIDAKAFYNCKKLATVTTNKKGKLATIGDNAFGKCAKLSKITLPKNVRSIGSKAFYNCKKLKTITINSTVLSYVGIDAFKGIYKKATIKVPKKKLTAYKTLLTGKGQSKYVKIKKG